MLFSVGLGLGPSRRPPITVKQLNSCSFMFNAWYMISAWCHFDVSCTHTMAYLRKTISNLVWSTVGSRCGSSVLHSNCHGAVLHCSSRSAISKWARYATDGTNGIILMSVIHISWYICKGTLSCTVTAVAGKSDKHQMILISFNIYIQSIFYFRIWYMLKYENSVALTCGTHQFMVSMRAVTKQHGSLLLDSLVDFHR